MIPFTKAHACGNDFLIIAEEAAAQHDRAELTRRLCARSTGIGADGIEYFSWTGSRAGRIRLYNADGSIAEISGNGTRCVAAWMAEALASPPGDTLELSTDAGLRICRVDEVDRSRGFTVEITTGMDLPTIASHRITLGDGKEVEGAEVSTGNPHFVIEVDNEQFSVAGKTWQEIGAQICAHPDFPDQTNVEFFRILTPSEIEIRIFERGVGPTLSSGTGSSASATTALALYGCRSPLKVIAPGGTQIVSWSGPGNELQLTGPASLIAHGEAWPL